MSRNPAPPVRCSLSAICWQHFSTRSPSHSIPSNSHQFFHVWKHTKSILTWITDNKRPVHSIGRHSIDLSSSEAWVNWFFSLGGSYNWLFESLPKKKEEKMKLNKRDSGKEHRNHKINLVFSHLTNSEIR